MQIKLLKLMKKNWMMVMFVMVIALLMLYKGKGIEMLSEVPLEKELKIALEELTNISGKNLSDEQLNESYGDPRDFWDSKTSIQQRQMFIFLIDSLNLKMRIENRNSDDIPVPLEDFQFTQRVNGVTSQLVLTPKIRTQIRNNIIKKTYNKLWNNMDNELRYNVGIWAVVNLRDLHS